MNPPITAPLPGTDSLLNLQNQLQTKIFGRTTVEIHDCLDSTNRRAKELGQSEALEGTLVVADRQTGGRGRLGRTWHSPAGLGLYFSIVLRPGGHGFHLPLITLATGLGVAQGLERICGLRPGVKWPNDLLLGSQKCSGILAETEMTASGSLLTVLGIGINVNHSSTEFPADLAERATSLMIATGKPWSRTAVLSAVLTEVESNYLKLAGNREHEIVQEYREFCITLGKQVEVRGGSRTIQGVAVGIEATGQLIVRENASGQVFSVDAGEVTISGSQ